MARARKDECIDSYYLMLGLKSGASEQEIKDKYRELAKIYHPDVNHSYDAEEKFKQINETYNYLISHVRDKLSNNGENFNDIKRTNKTNKKDIKDITDEILKDISKSVSKDIHKNLQKNLQKFIKQRNRIIYMAAVKSIKKEMKRK
ncbi:MAG: DnaJ domain-containing protein, partial [Candidatus Altarchaeum sp.]|nr:DnaJ domain-containing protein [Candidatus Altarchaeum sp.]